VSFSNRWCVMTLSPVQRPALLNGVLSCGVANRCSGARVVQRGTRGSGWTDVEQYDLRQLYAEGRSILLIAERLRLSASSVQVRVERLGLERWFLQNTIRTSPALSRHSNPQVTYIRRGLPRRRLIGTLPADVRTCSRSADATAGPSVRCPSNIWFNAG
jgi:hypothetical protein